MTFDRNSHKNNIYWIPIAMHPKKATVVSDPL
jgi:hypothetical protein